MKTMDIVKFTEAFIEELEKNKNEIKNKWKGYKEDYINLITRMIEDIGKRNELKTTKEYWHLDYIFYKELDSRLERGKYIKYAKDINTIIEHENNCAHAMEEVKKLCHWRTDLRVLITYYTEKTRIYTKKHLLDLWEEIIGDTGEDEDKFLIILCSSKAPDEVPWEFYEWEDRKLIMFKTHSL